MNTIKNKNEKVRYNLKPIKDYIKQNNISKTEFCKRCGVSLYYIKKLFDNKNCKVLPLLKILDFLDIKAFDILGF